MLWLVLMLMIYCTRVFALTDLAQAPINFLLASPVKPNIYFILDDSGSMQWSYLGDEVIDNNYQNAVGYRSSLCNKIYYNPQIRYPVPVDAEGKEYPQQNFTSASYDGFVPGAISVDLSTSFMAWRSRNSKPTTPDNLASIIYRNDCTTPAGSCSTTPSGLKRKARPNSPCIAAYVARVIPQPGQCSPVTSCRTQRIGSDPTPREASQINAVSPQARTPARINALAGRNR